MRLKRDDVDTTTVYADLGSAESFDEGSKCRERAVAYARRVGAMHIEVYRSDELWQVVNLQPVQGLGDGDGAAGGGVPTPVVAVTQAHDAD